MAELDTKSIERIYYEISYSFTVVLKSGKKVNCWKFHKDDSTSGACDSDGGHYPVKLNEEEQEELDEFLIDLTIKDLED
jgi:hypothetical protein